MDFLRRHADAVLLRADGAGPVAVSPALNGRVMTSAFSDAEPGFGLVNREPIERHVPRVFDNFGGEDRLWISPEGGPWALFFEPGDAQTPERWFVPRSIDGRSRRQASSRSPRELTMRWATTVTNVAGTEFPLRVQRTVAALPRAQVAALLADAAGKLPGHDALPDAAGTLREDDVLPSGVRLTAFRTSQVLGWSDAPPSGAGEIGLWVLGQFAGGDATSALIPFRGPQALRDRDPRAAIKRDYFGLLPRSRLALAAPGLARFTADGRQRGKLGLSAAGATGWLGAWDGARGVLTLVHHTLPAPGALVPDCDWRPDNPRPGQGDVAASYNDGGEPRFFELESLSSALPREPGAEVFHEHGTIHLGGEREALARIARALLHAEL